jgi:hypothetical protein
MTDSHSITERSLTQAEAAAQVGSSHTSPYVDRSCATLINDDGTCSSVSAGNPACRRTKPSHRLGSCSRLVRSWVLDAREELELAELDAPEATGRGELLAEGQEVLRGHGLEHDLLDEHVLDGVAGGSDSMCCWSSGSASRR